MTYVSMLLTVLVVALVSVCWTGKQPPNGPATEVFRHRTVQMFPVEPPVHFMSVGMVTVMLKSCAKACDRPFTPGTLLVTERFVNAIPALPNNHEN